MVRHRMLCPEQLPNFKSLTTWRISEATERSRLSDALDQRKDLKSLAQRIQIKDVHMPLSLATLLP